MVLLTLVSCSNSDISKESVLDSNNSSTDSENNDGVYNYIAEKFGFAGSKLYAAYSASTVKEGSKFSMKDEMKFKEGSNGGAVYYKTLNSDGNSDRAVCIYFTEDNNGIRLNAEYYDNFYSHSMSLATPHMKNRCYCLVKGDYLVYVELAEKSEGWTNNYYYLSSEEALNNTSVGSNNHKFEEKACVYKLNKELNTVFEITRTIEPHTNYVLKKCEISQDDNTWIYASGYNGYNNDSAVFFETEQEFCDRANQLFGDISVDCFTYNRTSWENRWCRLEVDESDIPSEMVKVDFSCSYGVIDDNGTVNSDIEITINADKEEHGELQDEGQDNPISYEASDSEQESLVMPENIPSSVDASELQDLRYFNLDGYWYSSDLRYAYRIYTSNPDGIFNNLAYTDLKGSDHIKFGTVKQTSSYSVNLKPHEDSGKAFEVFAVNNQLVSDEITLSRVDDSIVNNIIGSWQNSDTTYEFRDDGEYKVHKSKDSYWGFYFVIDENNIVLGKASDDLKLYSYTIEGNTLVINNRITLSR